jgi:tRNA/tmRNA/rRNA uracil-C5-methylase (TrmA/RlmC/RlmD family)
MLHEDQEIEIVIEKPVAGGRMLARHGGQVVLVAGTIPGERVRARIERVGRGVAFASVVDVLDAASTRRAPAGDPLCGGNVYAHVAYAAQPAIKAEVLRDALRHGGKIEWTGDLPVAPSPEHGYRMRARLHVRGGRAGFFREGTHDLCDAACTGQLRPEALDAASHFIACTPAAWLDAIEALELTENISGDQRTLHVLWSSRIRPPRSLPPEGWRIDTIPHVTGISADHPLSGRARIVSGSPTVSDPVSLLIGSRDDAAQTPLSPPQLQTDTAGQPGSQLAGRAPASSVSAAQSQPDAAEQPDGHAAGDAQAPSASAGASELAAAPQLQRHAASFFQANRFLLPQLVDAVARHVGEGPVVDLYAGVGLFAVTLAARGHEGIVAIEGDASSAHDLRINAEPFGARLRVEHTSVEQYLTGASGSATSASPSPAAASASSLTSTASTSTTSASGVVSERAAARVLGTETTLVVDPPRTGMSREALAAIIALRAARVLYVSCDVATFARDLRRLLDHGYALTHLEAFDLFPNTAHIESLAVLNRVD